MRKNDKSEVRLHDFFTIMSTDLDSILSSNENFAAARLKNRMRKRAMLYKDGLDEKCIANFLEINEKLASPTISLDHAIISNAQYFITVIFERFNSSLNDLNIQETLDMSYLMSLWKFGPGASNGVRGTHTAEKINQAMTTTRSAEPLVRSLRSSNPYFSCYDARNNGGITEVSGSKLTTVPKNEDTVRIIAIEPSGNMALQLAAGQYITDVLRSIGLDISTQQEKNKALALRGSMDGSIATIDLKSASDMFTPELIRCLMPTKWYELLMKLRSPITTIGDVDVKLNMISTMGNGFTFPLMTLCLVSLIYAYRTQRSGPSLWIDWSSTAVFGDDIIIPVDEYAGFSLILKEAGLVVNHDKSYCTGTFRESCGGDYNNGVDVTPFYVRSLSTDSDVYIALNQVLKWSAKTRNLLHRTLQYLRSLLNEVFFVPEWMNPDQGVLTSQVEVRYKHLSIIQHFEQLSDDNLFKMPLAIGGYIESQGPDHVVYLPRQFKTRYRVRRGKLPRGYLSGRASEIRSDTDSSLIDLLVTINLRM